MPQKRIHLIGIGGISMSGIASILAKQDFIVSGSDLHDSLLLAELRGNGVQVQIGHKVDNVKGADLVVISNAIPEDNPELKYARKKGITVIKRAQMIAQMMEDKRGIAVSGTHGKTTTTSMTASVLKKGGLDPTILIGGELEMIGGNAYLGNGDFFLTEADESDGSFLYYNPEVVVVTNVELDHLDYYDNEDKLLNTFKKFLGTVPAGGRAIICAEDKILMSLIDTDNPRFLTYGFGRGLLRAEDVKLLPFGSYYNLVYRGKKLGEINLNVPGKHNILNSLAAVAIAFHAGLDFTAVKKGMEEYSGVGRRFEKKGLMGNILVVDDYAHHPSEIKATLQAARNTGYERIVVVFQPHRYTRTKYLMDDFSRSFDLADHVIVTDIYSAGEKKIPGVKAQDLVRLIARRDRSEVDYIARLKDVVSYLQEILQPRDLVLTMGAGDVHLVGEILLEKMKEHRELAR